MRARAPQILLVSTRLEVDGRFPAGDIPSLLLLLLDAWCCQDAVARLRGIGIVRCRFTIPGAGFASAGLW